MSQRRRARRNASAFSLFAFQDIMTAVLGILIFVTLMLSLNLADMMAHASVSVTPGMDAADAAKERETVKRLLAELDEQLDLYQWLSSEVQRLARAGGDKSSVVEQLSARLRITYERIETLQLDVKEQARELNASASSGITDEILRQTLAYEEEIETLSERISQLKLRRKISYIVQERFHKRPILAEVSGNRIGIGSVDQTQPAIWLQASDRDLLLRQLRSFASQRNPGSEYFVVLLKPSAFGPMHDGVRKTLSSLKFDVGLDLIPEDVEVLDGSP